MTTERASALTLSWGVAKGRRVIDTPAHVATGPLFERTLCGVTIPPLISRFKQHGARTTNRAVTYHDAARTSQLRTCGRCGRCGRSAAVRAAAGEVTS